MTPFASSAITMVVGLAAIATTWTGTYANYVKPGLRWPLIISGLVLIGAGLINLSMAVRRHDALHVHGAQGIGALLVVFVAALALAPPPLGAAAASDRLPNRISDAAAPRSIELRTPAPPSTAESTPETDAPVTGVVDDSFVVGIEEELARSQTPGVEAISEPGEGLPTSPVPSSEFYAISLYDFVGYSFFEPDEIMGVPFQLVGFSAPEPDVPGGFRLTRFLMDCCATDALPLQVTLADPPFLPDDDQWVAAEAVWNGQLTDVDEFGEGVPVLEVISLTPIDPPADPYES